MRRKIVTVGYTAPNPFAHNVYINVYTYTPELSRLWITQSRP